MCVCMWEGVGGERGNCRRRHVAEAAPPRLVSEALRGAAQPRLRAVHPALRLSTSLCALCPLLSPAHVSVCPPPAAATDLPADLNIHHISIEDWERGWGAATPKQNTRTRNKHVHIMLMHANARMHVAHELKCMMNARARLLLWG